MPKYTLLIAHDVSCYAEIEIEADSPEAAIEVLRNLNGKDDPLLDCDPNYDTAFNHRVCEVRLGEAIVHEGGPAF